MSKPHALLAEFFFYILPTGYWSTRMLPEGTALLGILIALAGAAKALKGRRYPGLALLVFGLLWALLSRSSSGQAVVAGLAAGSIVLALTAVGALRVRALWVASVSAAIGAAHMAVSAALGLPGLKDSPHDFYGAHFQKPMPPDVYDRLWDGNQTFWSDWLQAVPNWNMGSGLALIGLVGLGLAFRRLGIVWIAVALCTALPLALHPAMGDVDRIGVHFWLVVALGLAVLIQMPQRVAEDPTPERPAPARTELPTAAAPTAAADVSRMASPGTGMR
ncbi:hypothetical protein [Streptodolium elevatio]|uniref:Uncharacterized protein n=1 Tax=Streptodolium elevatio TaxID=3157996 RepID=A0ABV3DYS5_9ACTN